MIEIHEEEFKLWQLHLKECESAIPAPPEHYIPYPNKGGANLKQSLGGYEFLQMQIEEWKQNNPERIIHIAPAMDNHEESNKPLRILKLIRKIWEK